MLYLCRSGYQATKGGGGAPACSAVPLLNNDRLLNALLPQEKVALQLFPDPLGRPNIAVQHMRLKLFLALDVDEDPSALLNSSRPQGV